MSGCGKLTDYIQGMDKVDDRELRCMWARIVRSVMLDVHFIRDVLAFV